jgi:RecA-family ATPase
MITDDDWLSDALPFEFFDDCAKTVEKTWLLKGLIALGEDSSWFGPPGSLKSSLLLDMAFNIAWRRDWRGHLYNVDDNNAEPRASIYFALERVDLVRARMGAYKARDKPEVPLPIGIVSQMINLLDSACVDQIVKTVWKFEEVTKTPVGLIIIDTFSKAIASGDEDKAQTQNAAAANLTRIHELLNVHIATIDHTGKNSSAGERGSNAKLGHVDLAVQISGEGKVRTAKVVKANDQVERTIASFQMEEVTVVRTHTTKTA